MATVTITINVRKQVAEDFRKTAAVVFGKGKGLLGKAVEQALSKWVSEQRSKNSTAEMMRLLEKGFHLGYNARKFKRDELYGRA